MQGYISVEKAAIHDLRHTRLLGVLEYKNLLPPIDQETSFSLGACSMFFSCLQNSPFDWFCVRY